MSKSEEMELQRLSQSKTLSKVEKKREKALWNKYFDQREKELK